LSNTLITISDNKIGVDNTNDNLADFYQATVLSATDYYAFGMSMKERSWQDTDYERYRYGFNGKEDDEDFQDYGMRGYLKKVGRFISVDPITAEYPELTPYQFASNTPIQAIDLDGAEST
jgi:RHS repeat-associated protein